MKRKYILVILAVVGLVGFMTLGLSQARETQHKLELREVQLQERGAELKTLEKKYQNLNLELDKTDKNNKAEIERLENEKKQLDEERKRLEAELQAKLQRKEAERVATEQRQKTLVNAVTGTRSVSAAASYTGSKADWLAASGIPQNEWWAVDSIVSRESGWNPNAVNKQSGACGLGQQLPCGKWAGAWNDPVAALKAQYQYVVARYGGYPQAVAFWNANHWY